MNTEASPQETMRSNTELGYVVPPGAPHVPLKQEPPKGSAEDEARLFYERMNLRRTVRTFSNEPVDREVIEWCIRAAGTAPSGANKQPWQFVAVSDPAIKRRIRLGAEEEERKFYESRASERWLEDLKQLGTDADKRFLEIAPWVVVIFALKHSSDGGQVYYAHESVGVATGLFIAACHHAGLATLTHTPSPMGFLQEILDRPSNEKPYLLMPVGYPTTDCVVPAISRKPLEEISTFM